MKSIKISIFLLIFLLSLHIVDSHVSAAKVEISQLDTSIVYKYTHYNLDKSIPHLLRNSLKSEESIIAEFKSAGFINNWHYDLDSLIDLNKETIDFERITFINFISDGIVELGKKEWLWGEGFIFNPTCPLVKDEQYWGFDYSQIIGVKSLNIGGVKNLAWFRWGALGESSNYTLVGSVNDNKDITLGIDYSADLTRDISAYAAFNYNSSKPGKYDYLLGGEYFFNNLIFILEYAYQGEELVLLSLNNSDIFTNYSWDIKEIINLSDGSRRDSFSLSYQINDYYKPSIELFRHVGDKYSSFSSTPWDWGVSVALTINI